MKYHVAIDSGGTKTLAILYDESFRPLRSVRSGSIRNNTTEPEQIRRTIHEVITGLKLEGLQIGRISGCIENNLMVEEIQKVCTVDEVVRSGEMGLGLAAAGIFGDGMLALSGTGGSLFARFGSKGCSVGGLGPLISDEGSGYWCAREAIQAAIYDVQGRGEKTVLTDLIAEHFGGSRANFIDSVFTVYHQTKQSVAACVAGCAPLVSRAADAGDRMALRILQDAGRVLAEQLCYLVRANALPTDLPVTISGSNWRSHRIFFDSFSEHLCAGGLHGEITIPAFEPVIGAIIGHCYSTKGAFTDADRQNFEAWYPEYRFMIHKERQAK